MGLSHRVRLPGILRGSQAVESEWSKFRFGVFLLNLSKEADSLIVSALFLCDFT